MCGSTSTPTTHDAGQTASTQQKYNIQAGNATQQANAISQYTPYGSLEYKPTTDPNTGVTTYTATQTLSPENQSLLNTLYGTKQEAGTGAQNVLAGNYGVGSANNIVGTTNSLTNQVMGQELSYLTPFFNQQTDKMDNTLRNQGLTPGTEAYDNAMNTLRQNQGQTMSGAISTFEPQAYSQALSSYEEPAKVASTLSSMGTPISANYVNTPTTTYQPANYTGAVASQDTTNEKIYNDQLTQQTAMINGVVGAASKVGAAAIMSDINVKTHVAKVGELFDGTPIYRFRYRDGGPMQIGLIAQDVEGLKPEAVIEIDGVRHVNYELATDAAAEMARKR